MNDDNQRLIAGNSNGKSTGPHAESNARPQAYTHTHERIIVRMTGTTLVTLSLDGREHVYSVSPDAAITVDDVICRSDELRPGTSIRLTTKPNNKNTAVKIESTAARADFTKSH